MIDQLYFAQLDRQYIYYLKNLISGDPFQQIVLRGGKNKPASTTELHQMIRLFQANEKQNDRKGWLIEWEEWTSRKLGRQLWPATISVTSEEDFIYLLKKENEIIAFKKQLEQLLQWKPEIQQWLLIKPRLVLELQKIWPKICSVVDYLLQNDVQHRYLRSISVPVHTKFIEQNKQVIYSILHHLNNQRFPVPNADLEDALMLKRKPFLFTARWLDKRLADRFTSGMEIFAVPADWLKLQVWKLERVIFVENETNLYLLPFLPGTLAICSYGKALHLLKEIDFLKQARLYYWGDMDAAGFSMLSDIRSYYNHIVSLFMDMETIAVHKAELDSKLTRSIKKELSLLLPHERAAYQFLLESDQWLEQEKLQQEFVQEVLQKQLSQ